MVKNKEVTRGGRKRTSKNCGPPVLGWRYSEVTGSRYEKLWKQGEMNRKGGYGKKKRSWGGNREKTVTEGSRSYT